MILYLHNIKMPMKKYAITILGTDQVGIVAGVSKALYELGFNLEDTSMVRLQEEFAMILIVCGGADTNEQDIKSTLDARLHDLGLSCLVRPVSLVISDKKLNPNNYIVSVIGADKPGIVYAITQHLAAQSINIIDLESAKIKDTYVLMIEVEIPNCIDVIKLESSIRVIGGELGAQVTLEEASSESL